MKADLIQDAIIQDAIRSASNSNIWNAIEDLKSKVKILESKTYEEELINAYKDKDKDEYKHKETYKVGQTIEFDSQYNGIIRGIIISHVLEGKEINIAITQSNKDIDKGYLWDVNYTKVEDPTRITKEEILSVIGFGTFEFKLITE